MIGRLCGQIGQHTCIISMHRTWHMNRRILTAFLNLLSGFQLSFHSPTSISNLYLQTKKTYLCHHRRWCHHPHRQHRRLRAHLHQSLIHRLLQHSLNT